MKRKKSAMRDLVRFGPIVPAIAFAVMHSEPSLAASGPEAAYVKSLAAPGRTVLVVEYYDGEKKVVSRKGYASARGFQADQPTAIRVDEKTSLRLYGLEPCDGDVVNQKEGFSGSCGDYALLQLKALLKSPKVILCRAFVSEENAPTQDVTCFGYYNFPDALDTVISLEEQLLSIGAVRLARNPDGAAMRPDLAAAEKIGRQGYGIWADPRTKP